MIDFYRIEHPDGRFLYVRNSDFIEHAHMMHHNYGNERDCIHDAVTKQYVENVVGLDNQFENILELCEKYKPKSYMHKYTYCCFFNNIDVMRGWFSPLNVYHMRNEGYILYKYSFIVDFDPLKIFICDKQSAIDKEYMDRPSTIKTVLDWNVLFSDDEINHEGLSDYKFGRGKPFIGDL